MNAVEQFTLKALAGSLRSETMVYAARLIEMHGLRRMIETGTWRGIPGDGQSTVVFGCCARSIGGHLDSVDISERHCELSRFVVKANQLEPWVSVIDMDSLKFLEASDPYDFAYLDSFDYDPNDPFPSQEHHLKEGLLLLKSPPKVILVDDCDRPGGGKVRLLHPLLLDNGYDLLMSNYQNLYLRP